MTNKPRTWEEFEIERKRLGDRLPSEVRSLERILVQMAEEKAVETWKLEQTRMSPHVIVLTSSKGKHTDRNAITLTAAERVYRNYFFDLVDCLTSTGIQIANRSEHQILAETDRNKLYSYLVGELNEDHNSFGRYYQVTRDIPLVNTLLNYFFLPRLPEQVAVFKQVVSELSAKKYVSQRGARNLVSLLYPEVKVVVASAPLISARKPSALQETTPAETSTGWDVEATKDYLLSNLGVPETKAVELSTRRSQSYYSDFYDSLSRIVGEESARALIQRNFSLLELTPAYQGKYMDTVKEVLGELRSHSVRKPKLSRKLGLSAENIGMYSNPDSVIELKQRVFQSTRTYVNPEEGKEQEFDIDIDDYKNFLLAQVEVNVSVARALTSGKTLGFVGQAYVPEEYFRKNTYFKMNRDPLCDQYFGECFQTFVRLGAITRKPKSSPTYRFNSDIEGINNAYLREYMRLALHGDKILRQEGHLNLNPDLVREFER